MTIILATILLVNERRDLNGSWNFWRIKSTIVSNSLTALVEGDLPTSYDKPLEVPSTIGMSGCVEVSTSFSPTF